MVVIEKITHLEDIIGNIHDKAKVLLSLSHAYNDNLPMSINISKQIVDDWQKNPLIWAEACFVICYAYFRAKDVQDHMKSVEFADKGIEIIDWFLNQLVT